MILEYRGIDLWDSANGRKITDALGDDLAPPPVAAAWLGGQDAVDPLDLQLALATLAGQLHAHPALAEQVERATEAVGEIVSAELGL
jgi:hypothetical protein